MLGAGLTGVSAALELARNGVSVTLVDQDERPMNRASLRNEGKIHLGFTYANDPSFHTARLQLAGALSFRSLLSRWIGSAANDLDRSTPFLYLVANDSLVAPAALEQHYRAIQNAYEGALAGGDGDYLGERPDELWAPCELGDLAGVIRVNRLVAAYRTVERAIDTAQLADRLREAVARSPLIEWRPGHSVARVKRLRDGFAVEGHGAAGAWRLRADCVINALWEGRLAVDATVGLPRVSGWLYRLRYRAIVKLPDALVGAPSATMVLGRYGSVAVRSDGSAYLSWYPCGLRGWSHELRTPAFWNDPCRGRVLREEGERYVAETLAAIDAWYPGIGQSTPLELDAGVVIAYGSTDIDHPSSNLHSQSRIGVTSVDGYHSVNPGKLTTAPYFACEAARRVVEERRHSAFVLPRAQWAAMAEAMNTVE